MFSSPEAFASGDFILDKNYVYAMLGITCKYGGELQWNYNS